ncbi:MAG: ATPase domain-containing protein [Candidatus Bipolaricaulaceae bacterium]
MEYRVFPEKEVEEVSILEKIWAAIEEKQPQRLVLDAVTFLQTISPELYQFRRNFLRLVGLLNSRGSTTLIIAEPTVLQEEKALSLAVGGVIRLERTVGPNLLLELRSPAVQKMRGSDYLSGLPPLRITSHGLEVYPHRVFPLASPPITGQNLGFGLPQLDEFLGGRVEAGTTTLIAGPSGVGKSTLGTQFLINAARQNIRGVLYTFEEHPTAIVAHAQGVGLPIEDLLESSVLKIAAIKSSHPLP